MANAGVFQRNQTAAENLLRTVYARDFRRQQNYKSLLLQMLSRNTKNWAPGKEISVGLNIGGGGGSAINTTGVLPPTTVPDVGRATYKYVTQSSTVEISEEFAEDADSALAAEEDPLKLQMTNAIRVGRHELNYALASGDGTGKIADMHATPAATATTFTVASTRGLMQNQRVDVLLKTTGAVGPGGVSGAQIKFNRATGVVTLQGGKTLADGSGDAIDAAPTTYAVYKHASYNGGLFGFDAWFQNSNIFTGALRPGGIDRDDDGNSFFRVHRHHNSGTPRAATGKLMQDVLDDIDTESDAGETTVIICGHAIWSHLVDDAIFRQRWMGKQTTINGWAQAFEFSGIPVVKEKHVDPTKMYFVDRSTWTLYTDGEGQWMDKDGAVLARIENYMGYKAAWYRRLQLVCAAPNANGVLEDLQYVAPS